MSEKITQIGTYVVPTSYCETSTQNGVIIETLTETEVELQMLRRSSVAHTQFATKLFDSSVNPSMEEVEPIAKRFVELTVVDDKIRANILKDSMACLDIYFSVEAQKDIDRFLATWEIGRAHV